MAEFAEEKSHCRTNKGLDVFITVLSISQRSCGNVFPESIQRSAEKQLHVSGVFRPISEDVGHLTTLLHSV